MYAIEDTKNMSRALRHAEYDKFKSLIKTDERFMSWLDDLAAHRSEKILFEWIDAGYISAPLNDVESIFIAAVGDDLIEQKNMVAAFACLTSLPDSTKALKKRHQCFFTEVGSRPNMTIEDKFHQRAVQFYESNLVLHADDPSWQDALDYHKLALAHFDQQQLSEVREARHGSFAKTTKLGRILLLLDALERQNWSEVEEHACVLQHGMRESDVFAWLAWLSHAIQLGATPGEIDLHVAWSALFWPHFSDPLGLSAKISQCFPNAATLLVDKDNPANFDTILDASNDKLPTSVILRAMLIDDAKTVTAHCDVLDQLTPLVGVLVGTWLDIMNEPDRLIQTIRTALRQHPTWFCLYNLAFSHALVSANDKSNLARELFPYAQDGVDVLRLHPSVTENTFSEVELAYIHLDRSNNDALSDQPGDAVMQTSSDKQSLAKSKRSPVIILGVLILLIILGFLIFSP